MRAIPRITLLVAAAVALSFSLAPGHGGGLDTHGCHHDRKTGEYHCHRGSLVGRSFSSQSEMLRVLPTLEGPPPGSASTRAVARSATETRTVARVVDGDTLVLDGGERVRLIGVDTPETVHPNKPVEHFGKEASRFTRRLAEGKRVRLEYDQANAHLGHKDRYGRTLGYVFLEDGTFLNAEIVKRGYGHAYTRFPFRYLDEFRAHEREAREQERGLWGPE